MAAKQVYGEPIIIPCRIAFPNLAEIEPPGEYSRNNFNLMAIVSKEDEATLMHILTTLADVAGVQNFQQLAKHPMLDDNGNWRDGDAPGAKGEAQKGSYFFYTGSKTRPQTFTIIDTPNGDVVECHPRELYAGAYCAILCTPCMYRPGETTLYLNAVTLVRHGSRLDTKVDPMQAMKNWAAPQLANSAPANLQQPAPAMAAGPTFGAVAAAPVMAPIKGSLQEVAPAGPAFGGQQVAQTAPGSQFAQTGIGEEPARRKRGRPAGSGGPALQAAGPVAPEVSNGRSNLSDLMAK